MLTINPRDPTGTNGMPVSITDDTGRVVGRYKTLIDAHKARAVLEESDLTTEPNLFARVMVNLPPSVMW